MMEHQLARLICDKNTKHGEILVCWCENVHLLGIDLRTFYRQILSGLSCMIHFPFLFINII